MKKVLIACVALLASAISADAQTEFRHISFDEARAAAKAEGKKVFVDFYTDWCGPCKRLAANVFPTKQVGDYLNANYVCLKVDAEKGEGPELATRYEVAAYPTLCVIDAEGNLLGSFAGLKEGDEFISAVEMCNDPELKPDRVKVRYGSGERNPQLVLAYAGVVADETRDYMKGQSDAAAVLDEYFNSLDDAARLKPENTCIYLTYAWEYANPRVQYLIAHRNELGAGQRQEIDKHVEGVYRNEAIRYLTGNYLKNNDEAMAGYRKYRKEAEELGYGDNLGTVFEFIDKRAECDDDAYMAFCEDNFGRIGEDYLGNFIYGISEVFDTTTPEGKKKVAGMLRRHIGNLPPNALYVAASTILSLENTH